MRKMRTFLQLWQQLKVVRDGFLIIVAGPGNEEGEGDPLEREGRVGRTTWNMRDIIKIIFDFQGE